MIRAGNGTRSFETLLRYRGAAMAEFWRALRTLKALQAEQAKAAEDAAGAACASASAANRAGAGPAVGHPAQPNEPEPVERRLAYLPSEPGAPGRVPHEQAAPWLPPAALWTPNEPETGPARHAAVVSASQRQPLIGQTGAGNGARVTAAALLRSMPDVGC